MIELIREVAIYGLGDLIFRFVGYASFLIYARIFQPEEFGVLALVITLGSIVGIFQEVGLNNATQRFYFDPGLPETKRPRLVSTALIILLVWSVTLTLGGLLVFYPFKDSLATRYGIAWAYVSLTLLSNIPSQLLMFSQNMLRAHFSPWKYSLLSFYRNLVKVCFSLLFILGFGLGLLGFFLGECVAFVLSIPISLFLIRKDLCWGFDKALAVDLLRYGYPFIFAGMGYWLFVSMDKWMLSELSNNTEVGLYSVASRFAMIVMFVNEVFGRAWPPYALKLYAQGDKYRETYGRVFSYWFFVMTLLGVSICVFSSEILRLSTPETYWGSAAPLSVLVIGFVFSSTSQITALGISLEKKTHLFPKAAWGTAVVNFCLNLLLIPKWGALGAALATLVSYGALSGYYLYWTQRILPIPLESKKLLACALMNLLALVLALNVHHLTAGVGLVVLKTAICFSVIAVGLAVGVLKTADVTKLCNHIWPRCQRRYG
jgi:O-antigen/teichoic acid export membrane protein